MVEETQDMNAEAEAAAPAVCPGCAADKLIRNCSLISIGAGILPLPLVDVAALGGLQVYMIRELCKIYEIPFEKERTKGILSAIGGGIAPIVALPAVVTLAKFIPVIGTVIGGLAMPALSAASTLAMGRIFKKHFAAGGSLSDVDVQEMSAEYQEEVEKAKVESTAKKAAGKAASATA